MEDAEEQSGVGQVGAIEARDNAKITKEEVSKFKPDNVAEEGCRWDKVDGLHLRSKIRRLRSLLPGQRS